MWYIIIAKDRPGTLAQRLAARSAHLARLNDLQQLGRLKIAGPMPAIDSDNPGEAGFVGSLLVVSFDSLEHTQEWANQDPYFAAGVYQSVEIYPFKPVLP
ncbi:MAG: YciI family protein [Arenimonas sp.]|nr:YciI family protein [Arenimonas sp.]